MHVLHTFANNTSVPYLDWFADRALQEGSPRYSFLVMYPEPPEMLVSMRDRGFACEWIRYDPGDRKWGMMKALPQLWRHMRGLKPDIVHCNLFDDALPGLIAARLAGISARVYTRQDTGYHWMHTPRWVAADRWLVRMSTHLIAISGECSRFVIEKEKAPEQKVHLVHNGIPPGAYTKKDPELMAHMRERFGIQQRHPVIGTVARFIEWKGHRHIIGAARMIVDEFPDAVFLLCGQGALEHELRTMVRDLGLDRNVIFTGWIDRTHMPSFYGILDIYAHAAVLEPFGLVYVEAMMNGIPVVSTPTGAALDVIDDGRNGILVKERSASGMADGVRRMLNADRLNMGEQGRITAMNMFNFDVMWKGTMDVYRKALSGDE